MFVNALQLINYFCLFMGVWLFFRSMSSTQENISICLHTTQATLYIIDNVKNNNVSRVIFLFWYLADI